MNVKCTIPGCRRRGCLKGLCRLHYQRRRLGLPMRTPVKKRVYGPIEKRLRAYIRIDAETGCHLWTGARDVLGYGFIGVSRSKRVPAHRAAWEAAHGPIPPGLVVMHAACDNPPCCNPQHLKLGTRAENNRDRFAKGRGKGARARDLERWPQWR